MRKMLKDYKKDFMYTWEHKKAYIKMEKELTGKVTIGGVLHDMDKLFLYLLFTKAETSVIHRMYARHHVGNHKTEKDKIYLLIDWECCRFTKPDKQETAKEYLLSKLPELEEDYREIMEQMGIW